MLWEESGAMSGVRNIKFWQEADTQIEPGREEIILSSSTSVLLVSLQLHQSV